MKLQNKTVLLTGATGGIGESVARELAQADARLILVSRNAAKLDALRDSLPGSGHSTVPADIGCSAGRQLVLDARLDQVDILINNAGVNHFGLLQAQSEEQITAMFQVNVLAPILLTRALLGELGKKQSVVVNIGSGFGSIGFAGYCGYSASKFALRGFTEALRRELYGSSVSVLYLAPRATATDMNPQEVVAMNRELGNAMDDSQWVAKELMKLLSGRSGRRYLGWPERFFIKLNGLFPAIVDKALGKQLPVIRKHALAAASKGG